jgi:hypothetical protein
MPYLPPSVPSDAPPRLSREQFTREGQPGSSRQPGSRDPRILREGEAEAPIRRSSNANATPHHDQTSPAAASFDPNPRIGGHADSVIGRPDSEGPAETSGPGGIGHPVRQRLTGPEEHRLSRPCDEVRTDDLMDPVDVQSPWGREHRPVAIGWTSVGMVRGVVRDVRLGFHDSDRPAADSEHRTKEGPGDRHGRAVEEAPAETTAGGPVRGPGHGPRAVRRPPRPSPPRS